MTLTLFGATGGLGRAILDQALEDGHTVRAHARSADRLPDHPRLVRLAGDIGDVSSVAHALEGSDAVLSAMGYARGQDPRVFGRGMQHIVDGMQARGVDRLIAISGAGLQLEGDATPLSRTLIIAALKVFSPKVLAGKEHEWTVLRDADVDWTLVRVARMVDKPSRGAVSVDGREVAGSPMVPYADVARWMIAQIDDETWVRRAPFVSGG